MSKFSSVKHYHIKNGDVELYITQHGTIAILDHNFLPKELRTEGDTPEDALRAMCDVISYIRESIRIWITNAHTDGIIDRDAYYALLSNPYYEMYQEVRLLIDNL